MPVLDRMLTVELVKTLLSVVAVLVTIIVSRKFLKILAKAIEGDVAADTLFRLLGLKILIAFIILLPAAQFLSILMVFGRMYRDQEMSILSSGGVGFLRLYRAVSWFVIPLCIASAYLSLETIPWAEGKVRSLMLEDERTADIRGIKPGRFNEFSGGDVVLYTETLSEDDGTMKKIFVQSRSGDRTGVITAESGYLKQTGSGSHFIVLNDGVRYQGVAGRADYVISEFGEYAVKIDSDSGDGGGGFKPEASEATLKLWKSGSPQELAELQRRLAVPLGVILLGMMAIPISRVAPRQGMYGNVVTAFLIYIVYENLQRISQGMLINGKAPVWLTYSGAYIFMLALIVFFLVRAVGPRWCWQVVKGRAS